MIDVVEEHVERAHALLQTLLQDAPFGRRNDPRHDVERDKALVSGVLAVDRERDADTMEGTHGFFALLGNLFSWCALQPIGKSLVMVADA